MGMSELIGVYKITNKINGKAYVGQSKHIKRRWREHINGLENSVVSTAIKKYGEANFSFEVLELCSIEELNSLEVYYIDKLETYGKGYNITIGGDGVKGVGRVLTIDDIPQIIARLREGVSTVEIAEEFNVCAEMINRINNGNAWSTEEESYPIRESAYAIAIQETNKEELIEAVATLGFKGAGLIYNMTGNGIKNRCEALGLPTQIKEMKELYGNDKTYIEVKYNGKLLNVDTPEDLVEFILTNRLTATSQAHIKSSVRRLLSGKRKSYLGIIAKTREQYNTQRGEDK